MKRNTFALALVVSLSAIAEPTFAQDSGTSQRPHKWYAGVDVGSSHVSTDSFAPFTGAPVTRTSGESTGFRVRFGYQFSKYFAMDVGYVDFGQFDTDNLPYTCTGEDSPPCTYDVRTRVHGLLTSFIGTMPLGERWSVSAQLGALQAKTTTTLGDPDIPSSRERVSDNNIGFEFGATLRYAATERVDVELHWIHVDQIGFGLGFGGGAVAFDVGSARLTSLGVRYRF